MYRIFFAPRYGVQEAMLDDWSGALRIALTRTLAQLQEDPLVGELVDPLRKLFVYSVRLFAGHLPIGLVYRVNTAERIIDPLEIQIDPQQ